MNDFDTAKANAEATLSQTDHVMGSTDTREYLAHIDRINEAKDALESMKNQAIKQKNYFADMERELRRMVNKCADTEKRTWAGYRMAKDSQPNK